MSRKKEIFTAVGTLGCAVAIGFVMQSSESAHALYGSGNARDTLKSIENTASATQNVLSVEGITLTSAEFDDPIELPAIDAGITTAAAPHSQLPDHHFDNAEPETAAATPEPSCEIESHARAVAAAMVSLSMSAPCYPNERVTVHHNGMVFTQVTDAGGAIDLTVPALAREAVFVIAFSNGEGAVTQTEVEDLHEFDRVVLQWKGQTGFEIHAREYGADYGDPGHVWSGAPRDLATAAAGAGGFLTRYGDADAPEALLAEVYTFPSAMAQQTGGVALSVETEVNASNCGLEIEAQTMQLMQGGMLDQRDLTLAVPDCDAVGSFLVLNNLLQDLKVAIN